MQRENRKYGNNRPREIFSACFIKGCYTDNIMVNKLKKDREAKVNVFRILKIDEIIRCGKFPNASYLCKKFEVSRSTIMRDIDFLRDRYTTLRLNMMRKSAVIIIPKGA